MEKKENVFLKIKNIIQSVTIAFFTISLVLIFSLTEGSIPNSLLEILFYLSYGLTFANIALIIVVLITFVIHFSKYRQTNPKFTNYIFLILGSLLSTVLFFYSLIILAFSQS